LIASLEEAAAVGLIRAVVMPRGSGKTTIIPRAALWAILTGRRRFVTIVSNTKTKAIETIDAIKTEIRANTILRRLYGREIHSLWSLHGESRLASGQRFKGVKTDSDWTEAKIVFGTIPRVKTSGAVISACGILGDVRGQQHTAPGGRVDRPDLILGDELQTRRSARDPRQTQERYDLVFGDLLGSKGPEGRLATILSGTVIYKEDLMDRLLDHEKNPSLQGQRFQMVSKWPDRVDLWDEYAKRHDRELRSGGDGSKSTNYVRANHEEMHRGAVVGWEDRFDRESEVSALQCAYNLKALDESTFWAEYQNDPAGGSAELPFNLNSRDLRKRETARARFRVPNDAERLVLFVDVQGNVLFYTVVAFTLEGRGSIIDYGTWPNQKRRYFTKDKIARTLQDETGITDLAGSIYEGLSSLIDPLFERIWLRDDGSVARLDLGGIDAGWGQVTETICRWCFENVNAGRIHPVKGHAIGIDALPWSQWQHRKTDRLGHRCKLTKGSRATYGIGLLLVDTNFWKTWTAERLVAPVGSSQSISWFESDGHRLLIDHLTSEIPELKKGRSGNEAIIWDQTKTRDNDFFDCLVGSSVLGSILGVRVEGPAPSRTETSVKVQRKPKRKSFVGM